MYLSNFEYLYSFQRYLPSKIKVVRILYVFAPKIFLKGTPEILNRDYKMEHTSAHRAKFRGDRRRSSEFAREKKCQQNIGLLRKRSLSGGLTTIIFNARRNILYFYCTKWATFLKQKRKTCKTNRHYVELRH